MADVALFTDPEEIYIMKRSGDVVSYDANHRIETVKIANDENLVPIQPQNGININAQGGAAAAANGANNQNAAGAAAAAAAATAGLQEYQLFVNRKEQICVMQSASEVPQGRQIKVVIQFLRMCLRIL